jgi:transposase
MRKDLYSAIDLHSNNSYLAIIDDEDNVVYQRRLKNDLGLILEKLEPYRDRLVSTAIESTFNWYWLADGLIEAGYEAELVNTSAVKQYEGLKHTGDRDDAIHLAHLRRLGILPTGYIIPREQRAVRDLARKRIQLVQYRTGLILSAQNIQQRTLGGRMSTSQIKSQDVETIAATVSDPNVAMALGSTQAIIISLNDEIRKIERELLRQVRPTDEWKGLTTIWGIGNVLGTIIMLETGPISRFKEVGNYASYCRCVKAERFSNGKKKADNNAKNGNRYLAWAFIEAAQFAIRDYPIANGWYHKKLAKVQKSVIARKALAHKLARAAYYVVRDGVPFKPDLLFR